MTEANAPHRLRSMIAINVLGGIAVLGSYAWGALTQPEAMGALWGGVPEALRPVYTVNMFLSAGGYFLFTGYVLFRLPHDTRVGGGRFGTGIFPTLYLLILLPSALWLPLTAEMVAEPRLALWWLIRADLAAVGFGSIGLLAALFALDPPVPRGRALAVAGLIPFCIQTALLDGIVWPAYFPVPY